MKIYDEVVCSQFSTDFSGCQKLKRLSSTVFWKWWPIYGYEEIWKKTRLEQRSWQGSVECCHAPAISSPRGGGGADTHSSPCTPMSMIIKTQLHATLPLPKFITSVSVDITNPFWPLVSSTHNHNSHSDLGIRLKINRQKLKHFNFYVKVKILLTQL